MTRAFKNTPETATNVQYQINNILKTKKRIVDNLKFQIGKRLIGDDFDNVVTIIWQSLSAENLGLDSVKESVIRDSLLGYAGVLFTDSFAEDFAHLIAGNMPTLRADKVVVPWAYQDSYEWVPLQIIACRRGRDPNRNRVGVTLTFRFLAGSPCSKITTQFWSTKKVHFFAKSFGFSRFETPDKPYATLSKPEQVVQLRLSGMVDPTRSETAPVVTVFKFPPSAVEWNKKVIKRRMRLDFKCPRRLPLHYDCPGCLLGYSPKNAQSCPAACHRWTYTKKFCVGCQKPSFFDKDLSDLHCVSCFNKRAVKRQFDEPDKKD